MGQQCTATAKSTSKQCRRWAVTGYKVCQVHGAGSPFKGRPGGGPPTTGKFSQLLPTRLKDRYEIYLDDPDLVGMREVMAVMYARLGDLIARADKGETGLLWKNVKNAYKDLEKAMISADITATKIAMNELKEAINKGTGDWAMWTEISSLIETIRRLSETEQKRLERANQMITVESLLMYAMQIMTIVDDTVSNEKEKLIIAQKVYALSEAESLK